MRIIRLVLIDIETQIGWMDSIFGTKFYEIVSSHVSVVKNFTDAFDENSIDLDKFLAMAGLNEKSIKALKNGYVNINRVSKIMSISSVCCFIFKKFDFLLMFQLKYFDYNIIEEILGNKTELFRLFKFKDLHTFNEVEKAFENSNKSMIAKALNSAIEVQQINNKVS